MQVNSESMKRNIILFFWIALLGLNLTVQAHDRTDTIHVVHYDINLSIVELTNRQISGYTDVKVVPKISGIPYIDLDLIALTVDSLFLNGEAAAYTHTNALIRIPTQNIVAGDTQFVRVYYHGTPIRDESWGGYFITDDFAFNVGVGMGMIPPTIGRVWFPCLDDFKNKATYTFTIRTDSDKRAVCNGVLTDSLTLDDSTKVWRWELPYPIATYVTACAVGNFQIYIDTVHGLERIIPIEIYAPASVIQNVPATFVNLKEVVHIFENLYGPYAWQRVGYTVVPFGQGAMEHVDNICYPMFAVDGTTSYEDLMVHEFVHMWFGNQITPSGPEQLWLKEGFAVYSEIIAKEYLQPNSGIAAAEKRDLHRSVIKSTHVNDGGYYPLDQIPQLITYGSHTYDKGALVVHSLRGYMGDELFYSSLRTLLQQEKFGNVNSLEFFQKMSTISGMDLLEFFYGWIHQPGFLHFQIDSVVATGSPNLYDLHFRQKLHHATDFANANRLDIEFVSQTGERHIVENVLFNGERDVTSVLLPFEPQFWVVDPHEKYGDALIDYFIDVPDQNAVTCADAYFRIKADQFTDTSKLYVAFHWVKPDSIKMYYPNIYRVADNHYWEVQYYEKNFTEGTLHFRYLASLPTAKDYELMAGYGKEDLLLLYRKDCSDDWVEVPSHPVGNNIQGYLITEHTESGEYALAIGDHCVGIDEYASPQFILFPNPANQYVYCQFEQAIMQETELLIYSMDGKLVEKMILSDPNQAISVSHLAVGEYVVKAGWKDQQSASSRLIIVR